MDSFFSATETAGLAIASQFTFKPYYNVGFHLDGLTSFLCHILRALYDLSALLFRVLVTPFCILNPLSWPGLPEHLLNTVDNLTGFTISLVSVAIHPLIFLCRSLSSMIMGYEEGTEYDWGSDEEVNALNQEMALW